MINFKVINILSIISIFFGLSMTPSLLWCLYYSEQDYFSFLQSIIFTVVIGVIFYLLSYPKSKKQNNDLRSKDGFVIVTVGWIIMAFFSSFPYYLSPSIDMSFVDSFFESMSGLTTTGASILGHTTQIEDLSKGLLFWRSFTHFIGGMGIIVFSIAILPLLGIGGVQLFKAEVAGPTADKMTPRVKQTAKLLWGIYVGFVLMLTLLIYLLGGEGITFFDSLCHSFATMATGGFSTHSQSIAFFNNPLLEWLLIVFMLVAATNFTLHFSFLSKGKFTYFKNEEFRVYFFTFLFISILICLNVNYYGLYNWSLESLRHSMFSTISILSTTGFGTENFELWPNLSQSTIFILLFIGGSAGSTTGGLKILRTVLIFKYLLYEMKKMIHPNGIYNIKIGNRIVEEDVVKNTLGFYLFYIFIFVLGAFIFSSFNIDLMTSLSASASAIGNIGPGLGDIGPTENWGFLPSELKILSSFLMLLGRLEIFTVMVLFSRIFWKY